MGRPTVADIRALKGKRKLSMLYVQTTDEAAAASKAGIDMLCVLLTNWTMEMREAAGDCFVQVGFPYYKIVTIEEHQRAARDALVIGGDSIYCASSYATLKTLADDGIPVVGHAGLIPQKRTWTGGWKAVGKTAESARQVFDHVKKIEEIGCFGVELEVVPDRVAEEIAKRTSLVILGMGAGPHCDAQYLFADDVLGCTRGRVPRHAKTYRDFDREYKRLQVERIAAFQEFKQDVDGAAYPASEHIVPISDDELKSFKSMLDDA
ncbi:3-methyl-2-oxobutanoate hydroxymethyltransferase [Hoeflea prorocentri]|uniref:3-methyl-2-oxobutanoate hydroxymethyltransferase n=1 Tax=Hoeflea prorocentri TaxID=1922333 RepID=A0A9X3UI47_9HYPH|nr:3-methyl-2-oxobutanoate hydroxymethyltransferase [Hoeflea prorocentri]MCY6379624.1 3-methyl-2-oxobutanoate hydroxymethyltransferase [Hoeflea prorocentri]MDA5397424.1 3-methyl-2-oxobutanoate hydroxymethyltransferase [Hoeflea prorocentri]